LPTIGVVPAGSFDADPGRTSAWTRWPRSTSAVMSGRPTYPLPPVIKTEFTPKP
jgi:hypothetical protein